MAKKERLRRHLFLSLTPTFSYYSSPFCSGMGFFPGDLVLTSIKRFGELNIASRPQFVISSARLRVCGTLDEYCSRVQTSRETDLDFTHGCQVGIFSEFVY